MYIAEQNGWMIRNEKTGRFESTKEEVNEYGYYSKVLNKPFDSVEELKKAEEEHKKAEEEKLALATAKKADAAKVEEAFKKLNAAKKAYNEKVTTAKKEYLQTVSEAKEKLNKYISDVEGDLEAAEKAYNEALGEFTKAHPEGYHVTLKDGDNTTTISRRVSRNYDWFDDFFNYIFKNF